MLAATDWKVSSATKVSDVAWTQADYGIVKLFVKDIHANFRSKFSRRSHKSVIHERFDAFDACIPINS